LEGDADSLSRWEREGVRDLAKVKDATVFLFFLLRYGQTLTLALSQRERERTRT